MFKPNETHRQPSLFSSISELSEKQLTRLKGSWADTFYRETFCRINEEAFADLYSDSPSRPNVPVNVLVGLEILKSGKGWSDEELYENYCYNVQVRYALGIDHLGAGDFEIRTLYYFRERLSKYYLESGVNLLEKAFEDITDGQMADLKVRSGMQRMDSTQIASNIVDASRLRLLVEGVRRTHRMLSKADRTRLAETFAPYLKGTAGQYTYRVKGKEATESHLQQIGAVIASLLTELKETYAKEKAYQVLERLFSEHFKLLESEVCAKETTELSSGILQSVDDLEASYRTKSGEHYKGYVANISETCDPDNDVQLITGIQTAPNNTDDDQLLADALPDLHARTDLNTMRVDGGFGGEASDGALEEYPTEIIQTAIRGAKPNPDKFHLADFEFKYDPHDQQGVLTKITCPHGQTVPVTPARKSGLHARFDPEICAACPFQKEERCRARPQKRDRRYLLTFTRKEVRAAQRRKTYLEHKDSGQNLRAAVEATVRSVKHPFRAGKLPVRGQFRVSCMLIASALHVNVRRIARFEADKKLTILFSVFWKRIFGIFPVRVNFCVF
jgi:hypothetical protein